MTRRPPPSLLPDNRWSLIEKIAIAWVALIVGIGAMAVWHFAG